ncbi:uncharacterized protein I303_104168 [Kwoniella dejecticola CBS 10117]|uniref:Uncharacterized protein n=1 Tax=Kwoniella dejecticola CBS 10117 TaxID=1296121 RepID=A0A1A6A633_9TREE|nr:uncharacterized protein I303_04854 [Kwoniella dejecticola CBS 10117]OBR85518.1 hypothetical protein I303_04854 [Kwoniella dejecticola CBS 10117]
MADTFTCGSTLLDTIKSNSGTSIAHLTGFAKQFLAENHGLTLDQVQILSTEGGTIDGASAYDFLNRHNDRFRDLYSTAQNSHEVARQAAEGAGVMMEINARRESKRRPGQVPQRGCNWRDVCSMLEQRQATEMATDAGPAEQAWSQGSIDETHSSFAGSAAAGYPGGVGAYTLPQQHHPGDTTQPSSSVGQPILPPNYNAMPTPPGNYQSTAPTKSQASTSSQSSTYSAPVPAHGTWAVKEWPSGRWLYHNPATGLYE